MESLIDLTLNILLFTKCILLMHLLLYNLFKWYVNKPKETAVFIGKKYKKELAFSKAWNINLKHGKGSRVSNATSGRYK